MNLFLFLLGLLGVCLLYSPDIYTNRVRGALEEKGRLIEDIDAIFRREKGIILLPKYGAAVGFSGEDYFLAIGDGPAEVFLLVPEATDFSPNKVYQMVEDEDVYLSFLYDVVIYYRGMTAMAKELNQDSEYFEGKVNELRTHIQSIEIKE